MRFFLIIIGGISLVSLNILFLVNSPFVVYYPHVLLLITEIILGLIFYRKNFIMSRALLVGSVLTVLIGLITYLQLLQVH